MTIRGLADYRLTLASFEKLGARPVTFTIQLRGVPLARLTALSPRERNKRLRAAPKQQLVLLTQLFPEAGLVSRNPKKGSWTLDGTLPANRIRRLAIRPEVSELRVSTIGGRSQHARPLKEEWFCVWGIVAIQVERQRSGTMTMEDRFVLVKARGTEDAVNRLEPEWTRYAEPYLNPAGYLVRWQLVEIRDVFGLHENKLAPEGTEVFSRLRKVKLKPQYQ